MCIYIYNVCVVLMYKDTHNNAPSICRGERIYNISMIGSWMPFDRSRPTQRLAEIWEISAIEGIHPQWQPLNMFVVGLQKKLHFGHRGLPLPIGSTHAQVMC